MTRHFRPLQAALLVVFGLVAGVSAQADTWPSKPIRLIVAYPAGGGLDFVTRTVAQRLSEVLGQQVVVENRSGASGSIGADFVVRAPRTATRC